MLIDSLYLIGLAFCQTMSFTLVSRARNRDNMAYHAVMSVASNGLFYLTFRELLIHEMSWGFMLPYLIGTVTGSLFGAKVAMRIEKAINALADPFTK